MKFAIIFGIFMTLGLGSVSASVVKPKGTIHIVEYIYQVMNSPEGPDEKAIAVINEFIDITLANARVLLNTLGLHTIPLPALGELAIGDTISLNLTGGFLNSLNTLHRTGDCILSSEPNDDIVLTLDAGLNDLGLGYDLDLNLLGIILPNLSLQGDLSTVDLKFTLRISLYDLSIRVDELELKSIGNLNLKLAGLGDIVNVIIQFLSQIIAAVIKDTVGDFLSQILLDLLNSILETLPTIPIPESNGVKLMEAKPLLLNTLLNARNSKIANSISIGNAGIKIKA